MKTYRIVFARIGRHRDVPPLDVTTDTINDLTAAVFRTAHRHVISREVDVVIDPHMTGGHLTVGGRNAGSFKLEQRVEPPVLDDAGNLVTVSASIDVTEDFRLWMAGRLPVACGHYIAASEARAGLTTCERCSSYVTQDDAE